jgi:flagellar biosynthetic protein FliO
MKKTINTFLLGIILILPGAVWAEGPSSPEGNKLVGQNVLDTSEALRKLVTSTLVIIVLGGAAIYLAKRVMPKVNSAMGREIKVIESMRLGPKKQVYVIKVGSRKFLIGGGGESITYLADVTESLAEAVKAHREDAKNE